MVIGSSATGETTKSGERFVAMHDISLLLQQLESGDVASQEKLWQTLYQELRTLAQSMLAREKPGHTLQPTALINEAYLLLTGSEASFANGRYFFGAAAQAMRRILSEARIMPYVPEVRHSRPIPLWQHSKRLVNTSLNRSPPLTGSYLAGSMASSAN